MEETNIYMLINNIRNIAIALNDLNHTYILQKDSNFKNIDFDNAEDLLTRTENLILAATHETASTLSFMIQDLEEIIRYIEFRKKYNKFTESDLELIIDHNPNMVDRKMILEKLFTNKDQSKPSSSYFDDIKNQWNKTFSNKTFHKLKTIISKWK